MKDEIVKGRRCERCGGRVGGPDDAESFEFWTDYGQKMKIIPRNLVLLYQFGRNLPIEERQIDLCKCCRSDFIEFLLGKR